MTNKHHQKSEETMREILTRPPKTQKLIAIALQNAPWPAWAPRPASQEPASQEPAQGMVHQPVESAFSSLPDVRRQAEEAYEGNPPTNRGGRSEESRTEQVRLVKIIGARMKEAREELVGFSQIEAAKLIGYKNSSKLAKIEGATDTDSVPLLTILRAAEIYGVSVDFLFGLSADWERDPAVCRERQMARWLHEHLQQARTRDALAFAELRNKVDAVSAIIPKLADGAENAKAAYERFQDVNPCYDDLIGGARLLASINALDEAGRQARMALKRLHVDLAGNQAGAVGDIHGTA
jgi:transcriptional regulator with XRE-family HTH domain